MICIDKQMPTNCYDCWIRQNMGFRIANDSGWLHDRRDDKCQLKAQEPCLLTWDELIATDLVYIETNKGGQKYIVPGIVTIVRDTAVIASVRIGTRLIDGTIDKDVYGIECRCWTSRPTDEQREVTPWLT